MHRLLDVDLRLIRIFRVIAECQGLTGAELVLHLSQSRISAGLAELEARLGVRLCRRGRSGFSLTEAGQTVYEASHDLFEAVDRFCNRAGAVSANVKRVLRLGTVDAVVTNRDLLLARTLRQLREQIPTLIIDFSTAGPMELESQLLRGSRDVIIVPAANKRAELSYQMLLEEKHSLYCSRDHPVFNKKSTEITKEDIKNHAFIARGYLHQHDLRRIGHRDAEATVETMEAQLALILTGQYIGYLPAHYAESWVAQGELRCLADHQFSYYSTFYAVTQPAGSENPLLRRLLSIMARNRRQQRLAD